MIEELRPEPSGRVDPTALVDALRARGFSVEAVQGLSTDALRHADAYEGLYLILLTRDPDRPEKQLDHAMLYRRTAENGDCVVLDPPMMTRRRPDELRKRWAGGYALIVAREHATLDAFLQVVRKPQWPRLVGPYLICIGILILAVYAFMRLRALRPQPGPSSAL